jgi:succinate-semialdehyde dehydrogenase/glutarate-semialdehyde dehydrogenase
MTTSVAERARLLIGGKWTDGASSLDVLDKFSGKSIGVVDCASRAQVDAAVAAAKKSFETEKLDAQARYAILTDASRLIEERRNDIVRTIVAEAGFPVGIADNEVSRSIQTFLISAEEGKRLTGEMVPIEAAPGSAHRMGFTIREPRGVVCGITSFNSPFNMVAHKVAPALASGNTVVVKPPHTTPFSAIIICEILLKAGLPPSHLNLVQGMGPDIGKWLIENQDIAFYTFTGSTEVGRQLQKNVGLRPLTLELGSISASIVCEDADLERAATLCAGSGFRRAGQVCTSVQRLFVHESVAEKFTAQLLKITSDLKVGDPADPKTAIGPMISEGDAERAESWVKEAVAQGARLLHGGTRSGALMQPTILTDVKPDMRVMCQEIFAPVLSIIPYRDFGRMLADVNAVPFGLAAGVFTRDIERAMRAARTLRVGVVHINESSSSRVDLMPFAGMKDSGLGREGPKYAMQEMTEERLITFSL